MAALRQVHLIQSNHLDVGFSDPLPGTGRRGGLRLISRVLNFYFEKHLPAAANTSRVLRARAGGERLVLADMLALGGCSPSELRTKLNEVAMGRDAMWPAVVSHGCNTSP